MAKKQVPAYDEPDDRFADVFHSFKDLHNVSPIQFLARLERKGVILTWKSKRRRDAVGTPPTPSAPGASTPAQRPRE